VFVQEDGLSSPTQNGHMTPSRAEVKAHAYERLKEELNLAQQVKPKTAFIYILEARVT
jgi:hypothetical protein